MPLPVADWLQHVEVPELPQRLAVGWSGGADSTALLLALQQAGHEVLAWHVDHGWRETSVREADMLKQQAGLWGLECHIARLAMPSGKNREAEARHGRLAQFQRWGLELGISTLCLAQHREDQAETVCMRLLQGAGAGGCMGMRRERAFDGLRIVRPLLHVSVQDLRQGLVDAGVRWFEDPSNRDTTIWRNSIRHRLFPLMQQAGINPHTLFLRWQQQAALLTARLDHEAGMLWRNACVLDRYGVQLRWSAWIAASAVVRARLLQMMVFQLLGAGVTPGRRHIELVEQWTGKGGFGGLDLSRCRLYRERAYLHLRSSRAVYAAMN